MKTSTINNGYKIEVPKVWPLFMAALYSYLCVYIIPWDFFRDGLFSDVENYIVRVEYLAGFGIEREFSGISLLISEVLWKKILLLIATYSKDYALALKLVSFISLLIYSFFCFRRINITMALILLFNPLFIDLYMGQLRMSLAFALALIAYELRGKKVSYIFLIASVFIHASIFLIMAIYWSIVFASRRIESNRKFLISCMAIAFFFVVFLKFGIDIILVAVEDKRANYSDVIASSSLKYSLFWFILSGLFTLKSDLVTTEQRELVGFCVLMMSLFFFSSLLGQYGQRFMAISIPVVMCMLGTIKGYYKVYAILAVVSFQIIQFVYWTQVSIL
ncbi:hypothetical protein L3V31_09935 [Vibrio sp. J1-1]|uniref:hypothetical protein n=1 Tax=Vibrio sp. J1-1 TaxID=2912251 RepID=UPI001F35F71C|nr:hypothetical protein [Vibrio sp. J1-1]MCF7482052.1 hypothetical protein [Vibrio sp. J1-1]